MPQLDITLNLIWYVFTLLGIGVLYLQNVYIYFPFYIIYWKFRDYYYLYLSICSLYIVNMYSTYILSNRYYVPSCTVVPYGLHPNYRDASSVPYKLDVLEYCEYNATDLDVV